MGEQFTLDFETFGSSLIQLWTPDEIYDRLDHSNLRDFVEDRRIERKSSAIQAKALADYLSMWSNTQPHGGIIIVGISDKGSIAGCKSLPASHRNKLESLSHLCPDARWVCKNVPVRNENGQDDFVIVYRVNYRPDKLVETSAGEAFVREADKKINISEVMKRELRISKGEIHYELEDVTLKYPDDFDIAEIKSFCSVYYANRRLVSAKTDIDILKLAKLGRVHKGKFVPNLACALLFANDPRDVTPGARIRVIRYEGTQEQFGEQMNSVYSTFVDGNVSKLLYASKPVIASQIRTFQRYNSSGKLFMQPEYPEEAWFEAIVNAVAHRSYNFKTQNIFVKIFDDKFVVESPGGFVPPTTGETVYDAHNSRNPYLMEAMMHLELTFCGFEGTRRMRQAMVKAKLPEPRFRQIEAHSHQVHVTLENSVEVRRPSLSNEVAENFQQVQLIGLSEDERVLLNFLWNKSKDINITHAALVLGKSWPTASKAILSLMERGAIELVQGGGRKRDSSKRYQLKKNK